MFIMQLLGDRTRYKMFKILSSNQELCVSDVANKLDISVSAVSQHFRSFEHLGLVDKLRDGQKICYSLREDDIARELILLIEYAIKKGRHYV